MDDVIPLRDDGVFVPLAELRLHRVMAVGEPAGPFGVGDGPLTILRNDSATPLFVEHGVIGRIHVHIALVAAYRPLSDGR